ncbi:MAG: hypothetical protein R3Y35_09210 [Clostridia bacterium]
MIDKIKSLIENGEEFTGWIIDLDGSIEVKSSQWLSEIEVFNETYLKKHPLYSRIHRLCFHKKTDKTCSEMMGVLKTLEKEFSVEANDVKEKENRDLQKKLQIHFDNIINDLTYSLEGIKSEIFSYTTGGNISNFLQKAQDGLDKKDFALISKSVTDVHDWYCQNINEMLSCDFCYNKNELKKNLEIVSKIQQDIDTIQANGGLKKMEEKEVVPKMKEKKIFISHSSEDKNSVELFVELLEFIGLDNDNMFCSSIPGYGIPLGKKIYDYLRDEFNNFELHVIFIHSENFYSSCVCLNEMGAAWMAKNKYTSILLPNFSFSKMKGVVNSSDIAIKLDNDDVSDTRHRLDELYRTIIYDFGLKAKFASRWEEKRNKFITEVNDLYVEKNIVDPDVLTLLTTANNSTTHSGIIIKSQDLAGISIQAGSTELNARNDMKECTKWEYALKIAFEKGFIEQTDKDGKMFKITYQGYKLIE